MIYHNTVADIYHKDMCEISDSVSFLDNKGNLISGTIDKYHVNAEHDLFYVIAAEDELEYIISHKEVKK